ncbi:hypothetical protein EEL33_14225 [Muribaculaceae bacterium Isolate-037 (Harlan)]|uniref:Uncharacterized protein n=1 Tax=Lepagella muris TaxID=3032870 RepID=A0AC61RGE6_9BACT|nr:hypothetical protein EEL33_14225 [Muribaculaceae bacterium Isolate-037 (Harlan)]TGY79612.1 hypothetical protein E5331_05485 [Lepagella muris]THG53082.1 hypothetical protein E5984_04500 [Bacteroidales bacterium]TKC62002.1 hypothetical protein E5359_005260 [Bacteroidales bacterium]
MIRRVRIWLAGLTFRTGVIVACVCVVCYAMSFLQMLLPLSVTAKGVLWTIFFGLAKTAQYTALAILGTSGYQRLKRIFVRR